MKGHALSVLHYGINHKREEKMNEELTKRYIQSLKMMQNVKL